MPTSAISAPGTDVTRQLAEFAASIKTADLPAPVVKRTSQLVLDQCGIALRARHEAAICAPIVRLLGRFGMGEGLCTVVGDPRSCAPPAAAFFNGCLGHALDFDDTHARGSIHPSAPIVAAALAAAETAGVDGAELVAGIVAGYEVQIRLSLALNPSAHYARGFHPTATCGAFGAAAAAARIFGAGADVIENALGLAGSQAAGSMQFLSDGAWNKAFHVGHAAMNGLIAAGLASEGFRGARQAIEGELGFLHGYSDQSDPALAVAGLGSEWETLNIAVKPYPSCRYGHAAMDALIDMRREHDLDSNAIKSVHVGLPATGIKIIGTPLADKQTPKNYVDGQFSMPFVAAVALREGAMGWDSYDRHLSDKATLTLCKRVDVFNDEAVEAEYPANMGGSAAVVMNDGSRLEKMVIVPKGEPGNFVSDAELIAKFNDLAAPVLDAKQRAELASALLDIAKAPYVNEVIHLSNPQQDLTLQAMQPQARLAS